MFFFFFQAEDGIRDFHVTGVQTCALPISSLDLFYRVGNGTIDNKQLKDFAASRSNALMSFLKNKIRRTTPSEDVHKDEITVKYRSEERRVGKECRTRWLAYH